MVKGGTFSHRFLPCQPPAAMLVGWGQGVAAQISQLCENELRRVLIQTRALEVGAGLKHSL